MPEPSRLVRVIEAAHRIAGIGSLRLLALARRGDLRIAGQDENGALLFRENEVLAAIARATVDEKCRRINGDHRDLPEGLLPCGCTISIPSQWWPVGEGMPAPVFLCREAQGLDIAQRLAAAFAAAAPHDPFFDRLAETTRTAFEQHLKPPASDPENGGETPAEPAECAA